MEFLANAANNGATTATTDSSAVQEAQNGTKGVNPGANDNLMDSIKLILNAVFGIIGVVSVIMIILGGISYATSQGDPGKVKKGKDTILYGVIGLIVALLAFAIVNFVLGALGGNSSTTNS
jgi:hypothetical protein